MSKTLEITQYNNKTLLLKEFTLKKRHQSGVNSEEKSELVKVIIGGRAFHMTFITTLNINGNMLFFRTEFAAFSPSITHEIEAMRKNDFPCSIMLCVSNKWNCWYTVSSLLDVNDAMFEDDSNRYLIKFSQVSRLVTQCINLDMNKRLCGLDYSSNQDHLLDFSLIVDNRVIKASKFVLAMKSKVFFTMFEGNDWKDISEGKIEAEDVEYETMFSFIKLLHGFELTLTDPVEALKLRIVSDKYEVDELTQLCDNFVVDNLKEDNAIETLIYATQFGLTDLKNAVIDQFTSSRVKFSTLPNVNNLTVDLCIDIIDAFQSKKQLDAK